MNHKVLLADDSLTIQKVIKITLANQPYDITEASSEEELFQKLPSIQPKLVFLDFNLSEKYTGYELTSKIKSVCPQAKILLLLGTFDTVDDAAMEKCGASDKIVKPFDSNKFIAICKQLIDSFGDEDIAYPEIKEETPLEEPAEEDQWTVSHSTAQSFPEPQEQGEKTLPYMENPLLKEVSDWGMSVPGVIDDTAAHNKVIDIPPVIEEVTTPPQEDRPAVKEVRKDEPKYPSSEDLDYPTIEEELKINQTVTAEEKKPTTSKLISIDSFKNAPTELELEGPIISDESDIRSLEEQIKDEVAENLWQADEFEDIKNEVSKKMEEVKTNFTPTLNDFDESLFKPIDDSASVTWTDAPEKTEEKLTPGKLFVSPEPAPGLEELRAEMEEMVKKYVKEYMDEYFRKNVEKVAWDVIPDLAENLIRQELSKISNKILNDQG